MEGAGSAALATSAPVYFDANPLTDSHLTGVGRYTARLALALSAHRPVRFFLDHEEVFPPARLCWSQDQDLARWARYVVRGRRAPLETPPPGSIGVWSFLRPEQRFFPREVSVLYDFSPLVLPATHTPQTCQWFRRFAAQMLVSSDLALAISHATKADATWLSDLAADRIVVAYSGPSLCVGRHVHRSRVRRRPDVGLVVSTFEPRKNLTFLFDWFLNSPRVGDDAELWWVGAPGWLTSRRVLKSYERPRGHRRIRLLGKVTDARLCRLYQTAGWTVYPSLYEGFGFPVLDSLWHGAPALISQNSALCEFDVPGVFSFDPHDAATVDRAWHELQARAQIPLATEHLRERYDWDRVARTLLQACENGDVALDASAWAA
jgi:glycosyltransferase involved in cell wall biosynthesis